jgi:hypothetical protein
MRTKKKGKSLPGIVPRRYDIFGCGTSRQEFKVDVMISVRARC